MSLTLIYALQVVFYAYTTSYRQFFEDYLTVESPGSLSGIVRLKNMRQVHFPRNPKIAELLHEYEYVREFGEGVDRMHSEMEAAGLPAPEYRVEDFVLLVTIKNEKTANLQSENPHDSMFAEVLQSCAVPRTRNEIVEHCRYKDARYFSARFYNLLWIAASSAWLILAILTPQWPQNVLPASRDCPLVRYLPKILENVNTVLSMTPSVWFVMVNWRYTCRR